LGCRLNHGPLGGNWYNARYGCQRRTVDGGPYTLSGFPIPAKGDSLVVLYTVPGETSTNAVAISDGNNVWHIEENGQIVDGQWPPDTKLDWSCLV